MRRTVYLLIALLAVFAILALIAGFFSTESARAKRASSSAAGTNLQTLALTKPAANPSGNPVGGAAINFVGEATVIAPNSPTGGDSVDLNGDRPNDKQASIYVVREGDTLGEVAEMFGVSVNTIVWANDLEDESISPEDVLVILPISGIRHEVEEGETISELAERFDSSADEIREYNELEESETLAVGAIVDIPGGEKPAQTTPDPAPQTRVVQGAVTPASGSSAASGYFINPVPGSVITQTLHGYNAVDFATASRSSIVAAASGRVVKSVGSGYNGGYGHFVTIKHDNGMTTLYSHLSSVIVSRGQHVVQGQVIGYQGETGRSTGPHLHFEVQGGSNPFASCGLRTRCGS